MLLLGAMLLFWTDLGKEVRMGDTTWLAVVMTIAVLWWCVDVGVSTARRRGWLPPAAPAPPKPRGGGPMAGVLADLQEVFQPKAHEIAVEERRRVEAGAQLEDRQDKDPTAGHRHDVTSPTSLPSFDHTATDPVRAARPVSAVDPVRAADPTAVQDRPGDLPGGKALSPNDVQHPTGPNP